MRSYPSSADTQRKDAAIRLACLELAHQCDCPARRVRVARRRRVAREHDAVARGPCERRPAAASSARNIRRSSRARWRSMVTPANSPFGLAAPAAQREEARAALRIGGARLTPPRRHAGRPPRLSCARENIRGLTDRLRGHREHRAGHDRDGRRTRSPRYRRAAARFGEGARAAHCSLLRSARICRRSRLQDSSR